MGVAGSIFNAGVRMMTWTWKRRRPLALQKTSYEEKTATATEQA
jgi:hypothetical protein